MEEENLNVDDYIYTSINNNKELLNLPDGSIIKRIKESHTLTNDKLYVIHHHCIKNDKGNVENVSCHHGCYFKLATLKEPLFSYPEYWYAKVTDELIDAYNEAIKDTTLKSISHGQWLYCQWLYFIWCRREDAWQKDDKNKYYINATETRNDIPTYCKCITTEEAVKFFNNNAKFTNNNSTNNLKIQDYGKTVIKVDRLVSTVKRGNKPSGTTITGKSSKSTIASRPISYETSIIKS